MFIEEEAYTCPICGKEVDKEETIWSYDCHGIPFRRICFDCYEETMSDKGYDGEYYTELDECIDEDW